MNELSQHAKDTLELVQVAAVVVAMIERIDRKGGVR